MVGFKDYVVSAIIIGIFIFAFFGFGIQLANENNLNNTLLNNKAINESYTDIESELNSTVGSVTDQQGGFFEGIVILEDIEMFLTSIVGGTKTFFNVMTGFYNLFLDLIEKTIGIPSLISNIILAIMILIMILAAWRVYKAGS